MNKLKLQALLAKVSHLNPSNSYLLIYDLICSCNISFQDVPASPGLLVSELRCKYATAAVINMPPLRSVCPVHVLGFKYKSLLGTETESRRQLSSYGISDEI